MQIVMRCLSLATMRCSVDVIRRSMAVLDFSHHVVDEGTLLMVMNVAVSMRDTKLARDTYERAVKCDYDSPYFLASMIQAAGRAGDIDSTFALIEAAATHGIDVSAGVLRSIGLDLGGDEAAAKKIAEMCAHGADETPARAPLAPLFSHKRPALTCAHAPAAPSTATRRSPLRSPRSQCGRWAPLGGVLTCSSSPPRSVGTRSSRRPTPRRDGDRLPCYAFVRPLVAVPGQNRPRRGQHGL